MPRQLDPAAVYRPLSPLALNCPRISPPGELLECTFTYAEPASIASTSASKSPAASCCVLEEAPTLAAVNVPATVPLVPGHVAVAPRLERPARGGAHRGHPFVAAQRGAEWAAVLRKRSMEEMKDAPDRLQWAMNAYLAQIGIDHPDHRARAIDIGERLEVLKDYPTPPNCTSPFAPIWITEMVRRQPAGVA